MATSVWKGQICFGLVNIPVRLQRAARRERVRLHYVAVVEEAKEAEEERTEVREQLRDESEEPAPVQVSRIRQSMTAVEDATPVRRDELLRGYEVAPDQYITFRKEELQKLRPATSSVMEIVRSVRLHEIDPLFFETSYYVIPDSRGEQAYTLLFLALRDTQYAALATVTMHGRNHVVIIRPAGKGLIAHTMYYVDEIRAENEYPANAAQSKSKELDLAKTFVQAIAAPFAPEEFTDRYREQVRELIAAKTKRSETARAAPRTPSSSPVPDIMEALKKSLEMRKPAASEQAAGPRLVSRKRRPG